MTMADFAGVWLAKINPQEFETPVLDKTGLAGPWDFNLDFTLPNHTLMNGETLEPNGPTIFDAVHELGLSLERRKMPVEVVVVDSALRVPLAN